jgi:hypothetical protein
VLTFCIQAWGVALTASGDGSYIAQKHFQIHASFDMHFFEFLGDQRSQGFIVFSQAAQTEDEACSENIYDVDMAVRHRSTEVLMGTNMCIVHADAPSAGIRLDVRLLLLLVRIERANRMAQMYGLGSLVSADPVEFQIDVRVPPCATAYVPNVKISLPNFVQVFSAIPVEFGSVEILSHNAAIQNEVSIHRLGDNASFADLSFPSGPTC